MSDNEMGVSSDEEGLGVSDDNSDYDFDDESDFDGASDDGIMDGPAGEIGVAFMTEAELDELMVESISKLSEITGMSEDPARALLDHLRWKVEDSITLALDDLPGIAKKAGLMLDGSGSTANLLAKCPDTECAVCMEEGPALALPCGHAACGDCWGEYVENEVEGRNHCITCVGSGCHTVLLNGDIRTIVPAETYQAHCANQRASFLGVSKNLKWCPTPDCGTVIKADAGGDVVCRTCTEPFCFRCGYDHAPADCANMKKFMALNAVESKDALWLSKNSKECPQCATYIQKDGGCNWVRCAKCKYEFCWLCFKAIKHSDIDAAGGAHRCNKFEGKVVEETGPAGGKTRNVEREQQLKLAHFYSRYEAHVNSAKLEEKELKKHKAEEISADEERKMLMEARGSAIRRMRTARNTLCSSYVFAFYQEWDSSNSTQSIFEDLQHLLESRTEALSKSVSASFLQERDGEATHVDMGEIRAKLLDNMAAVATNQKNLVEMSREGCGRTVSSGSAR